MVLILAAKTTHGNPPQDGHIFRSWEPIINHSARVRTPVQMSSRWAPDVPRGARSIRRSAAVHIGDLVIRLHKSAAISHGIYLTRFSATKGALIANRLVSLNDIHSARNRCCCTRQRSCIGSDPSRHNYAAVFVYRLLTGPGKTPVPRLHCDIHPLSISTARSCVYEYGNAPQWST